MTLTDANSTRESGARTARRLLMCAPDHYGVDYVINPWMEPNVGQANHGRAIGQWDILRRLLEEIADIELVAARAGLPDMVFTANAGLAIGRKVVVSRFSAAERKGEEPFFRAWFEQHGYDIAPWPAEIFFEGAGDALLDRGRELVWCGHGFRSSAHAAGLIEKIFDRETVSLRLVDPRFYHLDTCFCPLAEGRIMYYPPAFDEGSRTKITAMVAPENRVEIDEADALGFACNAVEIDHRIVMNDATQALQRRLRMLGYHAMLTPLSEFIKAGGAAKCLSLELNGA